MTVRQLLSNLSSRELTEWMALFELKALETKQQQQMGG